MARPRRENEPATYQSQPEIPAELSKRFDVIRAVLGNQMTISDAARTLSIARVNMQSLVHRAEAAILNSLQPRATGPVPTPPAQKSLEAEVERLSRENSKLTRQLQAADEMMAAAGEIIRSLRGLTPSRTTSRRSTRSSKTKTTKPTEPSTDEDPEPAKRTEATQAILSRALERLRTRSDLGTRAARLLGIDIKTLKRWVQRLSVNQPLVQRRGGVMRPGSPEDERRVRSLVEELHGLPGAAALAHSVTGVSRRRAAQLKHEVLTDRERRRQLECRRVEVLTPGIVRGFDAMYLNSGFALIAADACVPFRTTIKHVPVYDANHVAMALDEDFRRHGAPLVIRKDRARCHTAPPVASVLRDHGVLLLQGPAYHAQYYGQLERQNLEHRAWLDGVDLLDDEPQPCLDCMKSALNELWPRPTLDRRTAAQCWHNRQPVNEDRVRLHDEVHERAARLATHDVPNDLAMRLAIEQALTQRGYLRVTQRRQPLCD